MNTRTWGPGRIWQAWVLLLLEFFVAYQALSGGIGLIHDNWELSIAMLAHTPFESWTGPGWLLIGLITVPHTAAAVSVLAVPRRPRLGILGGLLAGASLIIWIGMQLLLLRVVFFLQPVVVGLGIVEILLAWSWHHRLLVRADVA